MNKKNEKILVTGALGQLGSELVPGLQKKYGNKNIIALDYRKRLDVNTFTDDIFEQADTTDIKAIATIINKYAVTQIYHLVGILSAKGENDPKHAWQVNVDSLRNILELSVEYKIKKVFWPSSIAVFGPASFQGRYKKVSQKTTLEPTTMYGVTKVAGELLCNYYFLKYGLDVRSLRYPGLISWKTLPGGGTTDYAVEMYHYALKTGTYECFVNQDTTLPLMYIDDALRATSKLMNAPARRITIRTSYNLMGLNPSAKEIVANIKKHINDFVCTYKPDSRQKIADSWPDSIDDSMARQDWGWRAKVDLNTLTKIMIKNLAQKK